MEDAKALLTLLWPLITTMRGNSHRQRQRVPAVVEGMLENHGGQHVGGAVVVLDVVLKVLLRGEASNCGENTQAEV